MRKSDGDRQRALDEVCRDVLKGFVGRNVTTQLVAEMYGAMRAALDDAVRSGKYVLPDGLALDRVEVDPDMRVKVLFKKTPTVYERFAGVIRAALLDNTVGRDPMPEPMSRFEAVAAEIDDQEDP